MTLEEYIREKLPETIRFTPEDNKPWFGLPRPFTVPCASGMFQEMYYRDAYFTNIGLLIDGNTEQAKNNVENLCHMADRFGFVLNGNREEFLNSSQPPFLSQMVKEVYEVTRDREWLACVYPSVAREYEFWTTKRICGNGLCRYDAVTPIPDCQVERGADLIVERLGYTPVDDRYLLARGLFAVSESGWDVNPRMTYHAYDYTPAELNSLVYSIERNMYVFAEELGLDSEAGE